MRNIIHVGANKTASTLFQRRVFSKLPHIHYIGEDSHDVEEPSKIVDSINNLDQVIYDEQKQKISDDFVIKPGQKNTIKLFSSEDVMGIKSPSVSLSRLVELMPNAELVVVLRSQLSCWESWYHSHGSMLKGVPRPYWRRFVSFDDWTDYCLTFPYHSPAWAMNYWEHYKIFLK